MINCRRIAKIDGPDIGKKLAPEFGRGVMDCTLVGFTRLS
jgi:hypothetical protein